MAAAADQVVVVTADQTGRLPFLAGDEVRIRDY